MSDSLQLAFLVVVSLIILYFLVSVMKANKVSKSSLDFQDEARRCGEKLLELTAEINQLLRELIGEVRSKR
jgi:CHASE3 domain sensor protein